MVIASVECSNTQTANTGRVSLSEISKYLPLEVGNEWYYTVRDGNTTSEEQIRIIGKKQIGLTEYYAAESSHKGSSVKDTFYYRLSLDGKLYKRSYDIDHLLADFTNGMHVDTKASDAVATSTSNESTDCIQITNGAASNEKYAEGVGLIERTLGNTNYKLIKAKINGTWSPS